MPVKKSSEKKKVKTPSKSRTTSLSAPVFSLATGRESGTLDLPKDVFGAKINTALLAQAMRIYLSNQKGHFSHTKTRGEVEGSTRKIYRQKGTGRARHGGIRAPIFVGGGIALGPKSRKVILDLPKKMKKAALISALSQKAKERLIIGISGLDKATGKTKEFGSFLKKINYKSALFVTDEQNSLAKRALKNMQKVRLTDTNELNAYEVIKYNSLIFTKESINKLSGGKNA